MISTPLEHQAIRVNGVRLHVVTAGPEDGRPVILLHGFPEFWFSWRSQIDALAGAGLRLYIPDQRGYNLSEKPKGVAAYNLDMTAGDIIGLIDHIGVEKALVVGHDWGGAAAWWAATRHPDRLEKLAVLNIPHHKVFRRAVRENPEQRRKVRYMAFFQLPFIPEQMLRRNNWKLLAETAFGGNPAFSAEDVEHYREAWSQPGAMTAMLNWYRAVRRARPQSAGDERVRVPTLMIWGKKDRVLTPEMAQPSIDLCDDGRLVFIDEASHWVQHEAAEQVNQLLIDWLAG